MRWLLRAVLALALAAGLTATAAVAWLAGTQSGLRWLLERAPAGLALDNPRGTLASGVAFDRITYAGSEARGVSFEVDLHALLYGTVSVGRLRIDALRVAVPERRPGGGPAALPFRLHLADARVSKLSFMGYEARDVAVDYSGDASGHRVEASFSAFGASARLKAELSGEAALEQIEAQVRNLDLAAIDARLPRTDLRAELSGKPARGTKLAGTIEATNARPGPLDEDRLPLASLRASFATDFDSLGFQGLRATLAPGGATLAPGGAISGEGDLGRAESAIRLQVHDLNLRGLYSSLRATRLSGALLGVLSPGRQRVQGTLSQDDLSLMAEAERTGNRVEVRSLRARAGGGEASGSARVLLGKPLRVEAALDLARFDPARFGDYPAGSINGALGLDGEWGDKARGGHLRWEIAGGTLGGKALASRGRARLEGERVRDADAWLEWGEGRATARGALGGPQDRLDWTLQVPSLAAFLEDFDGEVKAHGTAAGGYRRPRLTVSAEASALQLGAALSFDRATLEAAGTLDAHDATLTAKNADLDLSAKLRGGWLGKQGWRGELRSLRNAGRYPLAQRAPSTLEVGPGRAVLGRLDAELAGGGIAAQGVRWEGGRLSSSGSYGALPAQWIISLLGLDKPPSATLLLDGEWDLVSTPRLNGRVTARRASGDLALPGPPPRELGLERAVLDARFTDGRIAATLDVASRLGTARVEGDAGGIDPKAPVSFVAELQLADLRSLTEPLFTQGRISGRVGATLKGSGTLGEPVLTGTLRGDALALDLPPYGVALKDGKLRAELEGDRLRVVEAQISGGEGRFSASGVLPLRPAAGGARLDWSADRLQVFGRPDLRLVVSGEGSAGFDQRRLALHGKLRVDSGRVEYKENSLPKLGDDVEIAGRPGEAGAKAGVRQAKRAPLPVDLDVQLDLGRQLALLALGFDGKLEGEVHLTSESSGAIDAKGRVRAVNARFRAYGQELEVDPGALLFDGPIEKPGLDISAWRRHQQVEAGVHVTGTPEAPRIELISNPAVPEQEKLSWLVLGRAPASGADLAVLEATTGALLGSGSDPSFSRRLANRFGLDELTVRTSSELTTNQVAANVFALGKRLSDQLYIGFEQTLGATTEYIVKADYALTQRLSLRGTTGTTSGVGLFYRYSWD